MKIERMGIDAYRNLEHLVLDFDDVNVIYGENAQGKTNLIEAVYLFTGAKSFRGARDSELVQFGKEQAHVVRVVRQKKLSCLLLCHTLLLS